MDIRNAAAEAKRRIRGICARQEMTESGLSLIDDIPLTRFSDLNRRIRDPVVQMEFSVTDMPRLRGHLGQTPPADQWRIEVNVDDGDPASTNTTHQLPHMGFTVYRNGIRQQELDNQGRSLGPLAGHVFVGPHDLHATRGPPPILNPDVAFVRTDMLGERRSEPRGGTGAYSGDRAIMTGTAWSQRISDFGFQTPDPTYLQDLQGSSSIRRFWTPMTPLPMMEPLPTGGAQGHHNTAGGGATSYTPRTQHVTAATSMAGLQHMMDAGGSTSTGAATGAAHIKAAAANSAAPYRQAMHANLVSPNIDAAALLGRSTTAAAGAGTPPLGRGMTGAMPHAPSRQPASGPSRFGSNTGAPFSSSLHGPNTGGMAGGGTGRAPSAAPSGSQPRPASAVPRGNPPSYEEATRGQGGPSAGPSRHHVSPAAAPIGGKPSKGGAGDVTKGTHRGTAPVAMPGMKKGKK